MKGTTVGDIKGHTRSLHHGSYVFRESPSSRKHPNCGEQGQGVASKKESLVCMLLVFFEGVWVGGSL